MRGEERGKFENWLINARAPQSQKGRGQQKSNEDFSLHSVEGGFLALLPFSLSSRALPTGFCGPLAGGERWRWKGVLIRKNVRLEEEEEAAENV